MGFGRKLFVGLWGVIGLAVIAAASSSHPASPAPTPAVLSAQQVATVAPTPSPTVTPIATPAPTPTPTVTPRPTPRAVTPRPVAKVAPRPAVASTPASTASGYTNSDGNYVPSPTHADTPPAGASAQCADGTYSFSVHRSGTCSHHGGVAVWL
jgi:hypothetical protein